MTTMNISSPDDMKGFVGGRMAREGFASANEYLLTLAQEARRKARHDLEAKLHEALEGGPATPMIHDDWVALRDEAVDGLSGESIRP